MTAKQGFARGHKRGNPNWGRKMGLLPELVPSAFEKLLGEMKIAEDDRARIANSIKVKAFVARFWTTKYVPEWLLKTLGYDPGSVEYFGA